MARETRRQQLLLLHGQTDVSELFSVGFLCLLGRSGQYLLRFMGSFSGKTLEISIPAFDAEPEASEMTEEADEGGAGDHIKTFSF